MGVECRAGESAAARYRRRRPEHSILYRTVQQHLEPWLAHCREGRDGDGPVPEYVEREFRRYPDCGILACGFARAYCDACGHDFLVAFSCQGRGVCPSCNAVAAGLIMLPNGTSRLTPSGIATGKAT